VAPIVEVSPEPEAETIAAVADIAPAVADIPDVVAEVSAVEEVSKASVPRTIEEGIVFSIEAPNAQCVQLAGDFNGWTAEGNELELNAGIWRKVVPLPPGLYLYRFVVGRRVDDRPLERERSAHALGRAEFRGSV
jgi:hypothetical protein